MFPSQDQKYWEVTFVKTIGNQIDPLRKYITPRKIQNTKIFQICLFKARKKSIVKFWFYQWYESLLQLYNNYKLDFDKKYKSQYFL